MFEPTKIPHKLASETRKEINAEEYQKELAKVRGQQAENNSPAAVNDGHSKSPVRSRKSELIIGLSIAVFLLTLALAIIISYNIGCRNTEKELRTTIESSAYNSGYDLGYNAGYDLGFEDGTATMSKKFNLAREQCSDLMHQVTELEAELERYKNSNGSNNSSQYSDTALGRALAELTESKKAK